MLISDILITYLDSSRLW